MNDYRKIVANYTLVFFLILLFIVSTASAAEVTLTTAHTEYYFPVGEDGVVPVTIVSTYDHDVTGTLKQAVAPLSNGTTSPGSGILTTRALSAFTEKRTIGIPVGKSNDPADYLVTFTFGYEQSGDRNAMLGGIVVHFVTSTENSPVNHETLVSTDAQNPVAAISSGNSVPSAGNPPATGPAAALQNNQMPQDASALRQQLVQESNQTGTDKDELLGYLATDPLLASIGRSLAGAGFTPGNTDVIPISNRSGSFTRIYSSGTKTVLVNGVLRETRVAFAEELSGVPIPLPDPLRENVSYREYTDRVAGAGFLRNQTRINVTPDRQTVDLQYSNSLNRLLHVNAEIANGSVISISGDNPDDPTGLLVPLVGLVAVVVLSGGIWYLARRRPEEMVIPPENIPMSEPAQTLREIASTLLDEAEQDAARGSWPEAYRKTGRALRIFLSHEMSRGDELTGEETELLLGTRTGDAEKIRFILDRCRTGGFARRTPDMGELHEMTEYIRGMLGMDINRKDCRNVTGESGSSDTCVSRLKEQV